MMAGTWRRGGGRGVEIDDDPADADRKIQTCGTLGKVGQKGPTKKPRLYGRMHAPRYQGMGRPGVRQVPVGSGEQGKI